jgi:PhnB protein
MRMRSLLGCGTFPIQIRRRGDPSTEEERMTEVIPYLCIRDAGKAIEFYVKAFGARETFTRITDSNGRIGHAEIQIGVSTIMLADEHPEHGFLSPLTLKGAHMQFFVAVDDADAAVACAVGAGGRLTRPVQNQFYGHRSGEVTDPFGYRWTLSTKIEDVPDEEMQRRAAEV